MILDYYKSLFNTKDLSTTNSRWDPGTCKLSHTDIQLVGAPVSREEIKEAMFNFKPYKAPGPDGLHPYFYQRYWPELRGKVSHFCEEIFNTNIIPEELNKTLVCLIPKIKHLSTIQQFRPISLCNTLYKLIIKIIVNHLKPIVTKIIGPTQTSF